MYDYINNVLAGYFNSQIGYSENEAIQILRADLASTPTLFEGLRSDLSTAFGDKAYSWKNAFKEYDVVFIDNEEDARAYAWKVLWLPFFN